MLLQLQGPGGLLHVCLEPLSPYSTTLWLLTDFDLPWWLTKAGCPMAPTTCKLPTPVLFLGCPPRKMFLWWVLSLGLGNDQQGSAVALNSEIGVLVSTACRKTVKREAKIPPSCHPQSTHHSEATPVHLGDLWHRTCPHCRLTSLSIYRRLSFLPAILPSVPQSPLPLLSPFGPDPWPHG